VSDDIIFDKKGTLMKNVQKYLMLMLTIAFCTSFRMFAMEPIGEANTSNESGREVNVENQQILKAHINTLKSFQKKLKNRLDEEISSTQRSNIQQLQKDIQKLIKQAYNMYFGGIPVNIKLIEIELIYLKTDVLESLNRKYW
jgi:TolA-binding protein